MQNKQLVFALCTRPKNSENRAWLSRLCGRFAHVRVVTETDVDVEQLRKELLAHHQEEALFASREGPELWMPLLKCFRRHGRMPLYLEVGK
jgi:hypothetical protein